MPLFENSGPGPPAVQCSCSTCVEEPHHTVRCHFCKVCFFKIEEDAGQTNSIATDGLDFNFMPGKVVWLCPDCSDKSIADVGHHQPEADTSVPSWFQNFFVTMVDKMSEMDSKLNSKIEMLSDNYQTVLEKVSAIHVALDSTPSMLDISSPLRKKSKTDNALSTSNSTNTMEKMHDSCLTSSKWKLPLPSENAPILHQDLPIQPLPADKFRIKLKRDSNKCNTPINSTLQNLAKNGKLKHYKNISKSKYAIDLLFPDTKQCDSALNELKKSLNAVNDIHISSPEVVCPKRTYFVGLPEGMDAQELHELLCANYPGLSLSTENKYCIKIFEPKQCLRKSDVYRCTVLLSDELYDFFMNRLGGHLSLGNYVRLHVFTCITRCIKCQCYEHSYEQCLEKNPTCANCGKCHYTNVCSLDNDPEKLSCVNCAKSTKFKDLCKGHAASDRTCNVYKDISGQG